MSTLMTEEVTSLNRKWMQAYVDRDAEFLERHLAEDYVSSFPDGAVLDKTSEIQALKSGAVTISAMQPREMKVRVYGEVAVITGQSTIRARVGDKEEIGEYRFTDVWARSAGI